MILLNILNLETLPNANVKDNINPNGKEIINKYNVLSKPDKTIKKFLIIKTSCNNSKYSLRLNILLNNFFLGT